MLKDKIIGTLIVAACIFAVIAYTSLLFFYDPYLASVINLGSTANVRFGLISTTVRTAVLAVLAIGIWIAYQMAATPPPKPFDITKENIEQKSTKQPVSEN